jgi:hypothetical protein
MGSSSSSTGSQISSSIAYSIYFHSITFGGEKEKTPALAAKE